MKKHRNIVLVGMMGSGKSAVGKTLARELGWLHRDLDDRIEAEAKTGIPAIFDREGEGGFRDRESAAILALTACTHTVLSTGGGAVLRERNRAIMRQWGLVVHLEADLACLVSRLTGEVESRPLLAREKDLRGKLAELLQSREAAYTRAAHHVVDTSDLTVGDVAARILTLATLDRDEDAL